MPSMNGKVKVALPDLISNSYFPAVAAVELGCFKAQGIDAEIELIFPVSKAYEALKEGKVDFVAGSAHSALSVFPNWEGVKLLCAQGQGMYWFLVMDHKLDTRRGALECVKGRSIGAAPWVDLGLRALLQSAGIDIAADRVNIAPVPGTTGAGVNFGVTAAMALQDGKIDGFWANGMGAEVAVQSGAGTMVIDVRRGDGPKDCFNFTMASIATSDALIERSPALAAAAVRAVVDAQRQLRQDYRKARAIGEKLFPAREAGLIAELVRRDLPFYDAAISKEFVSAMNGFALRGGFLAQERPYEDVVATQFSALWQGQK